MISEVSEVRMDENWNMNMIIIILRYGRNERDGRLNCISFLPEIEAQKRGIVFFCAAHYVCLFDPVMMAQEGGKR